MVFDLIYRNNTGILLNMSNFYKGGGFSHYRDIIISSIISMAIGTAGMILYQKYHHKLIQYDSHSRISSKYKPVISTDDDDYDDDNSNDNDDDNNYHSNNRQQHSSTKEQTLIGTPHPSAEKREYLGCVYLDYNATTCIFPEVTKAMLPFLSTSFGNPSSNHIYAKPCKDAINQAREYVRRLINAPSSNFIYFTSCGSESDNRAIDIAMYHYHHNNDNYYNKNIKPHIITSAIEHPAILGYLYHLQQQNIISLDVIKVNNEGFLNLDDFRNHLTITTALVTIMHSNNEVGTIQPIKEIAAIIKSFNQMNQCDILLHVDAAQSIGKVLVDVKNEGIDMLTIVGHKYGAPKGIAALYIRDNIKTCPMLIGGGQERGLRAGTENVLLIVGLGEASRLAFIEADKLLIHMLTLKIQLMKFLQDGLKSIGEFPSDIFRLNGPNQSIDLVEISSCLKLLNSIQKTSMHQKNNHNETNNDGNSKCIHQEDEEKVYHSIYGRAGLSSIVHQLPNTVSISFKNIKAHDMLTLLYDKVACSPGSACHTADVEEKISIVLEAMNVPYEYATGTLRLSFGRHTSEKEIEKAANYIINAVKQLHGNQL